MDCIFCKIASNEAPSEKIYENGKVLSFLSIGPVNKGHALVIPKEHYENIFDIPEELLKNVIVAAKKVAKAVMESTGAEGISISQSNHHAGGQVVFHIHFHIMPRYRNDGLRLWPHKSYEEGEMQEYAEKIRSRI